MGGSRQTRQSLLVAIGAWCSQPVTTSGPGCNVWRRGLRKEMGPSLKSSAPRWRGTTC